MEKKCFNCNQTGHLKKDCTTVAQNQITAAVGGEKDVVISTKKKQVIFNASSSTADGIRPSIYQYRTSIQVGVAVDSEDDLDDEISDSDRPHLTEDSEDDLEEDERQEVLVKQADLEART